jgi:hypothetical protein
MNEQILQSLTASGWKFVRQHVFQGITTMHFERGNIYKDAGGGAFLEYTLPTGRMKFTSTDVGYNADGPNHSIKYNGPCQDVKTLDFLHDLLGV